MGVLYFSGAERYLLMKPGRPLRTYDKSPKGPPLQYPRISSAPFRTRVALLFSAGFISYLPSCAHASPPPCPPLGPSFFAVIFGSVCHERMTQVGLCSHVNVRAYNEQHPHFINVRRQPVHPHSSTFSLLRLRDGEAPLFLSFGIFLSTMS